MNDAGTGTRPRELVVLGSGTARPTPHRGSPGYLLRFAGGRGILMDPGPGSVRAAARAGCEIDQLVGALITHFHPDHCLDLFALIFGLRNPAHEGCRLTLLGPRGLGGLYERMGGVYGDWCRLPPERLDLVELEPGPLGLDVQGCRLEGSAVSMPHLGHSLGYRLQGQRRSVAYSGDTGLGEAPVELGHDVDLYVLEAAFPDGSDTGQHLTPETAGQVAAAAGARELCITHLYPETEQGDVLGSVRRAFPGPVCLAADQMVLEL